MRMRLRLWQGVFSRWLNMKRHLGLNRDLNARLVSRMRHRSRNKDQRCLNKSPINIISLMWLGVYLLRLPSTRHRSNSSCSHPVLGWHIYPPTIMRLITFLDRRNVLTDVPSIILFNSSWPLRASVSVHVRLYRLLYLYLFLVRRLLLDSFKLVLIFCQTTARSTRECVCSHLVLRLYLLWNIGLL